MIISLDLNQLEELGLRPDEFIYLECQKKKINFSTLIVDTRKLERQGYIKVTESGIILRSKYLDYFNLDESTAWREFCNKYPFKVNGPTGERILHTHDPDAKSNEKTKKRYLKIVAGKPALHKKILKALDLYLTRNRANLGYLPALATFVNNQGWEAQFHELENTSIVKKQVYGGQLK